MFRLKLALGAILLLAVPVTLAGAQGSAPTVAVTVSQGNMTFAPAAPTTGGPTRFTYAGRGELVLATLRAGVTLEELRQSLQRRNQDEALEQVFIEAAVQRGTPATVNLRPNTTYVAAGGANARVLTTFTTGADSGAAAPRPDARIRMVDYGFRGRRTLPRNGRIRFVNDGTTFHFAIAFPLRRGVSTRRANRVFRGDNDRAAGRIVAGAPVDALSLISQGSTQTNEIRFPRRGRYAMVCFFGAHNELGMSRVYRAR
jgi:hypothetical protein